MRIRPDWNVEAWVTKTSGARAFAVGDGKVILFGGYRDNQSASRWLSLDGHEANLKQNLTLSLTDGGDFATATVIGRGDILHVLTDEIWYQFSTSSLP